MAIIRWRPLEDVDKFFRETNLLQNQVARDLATDVYEENGNVIVEMHVAGINPDKVDISVEGDHLRVSGSREEEKEKKDRDYYEKEISRGSFDRTIHLPVSVSSEKTRAEVKHGVLKITLPKLNKGEARKISIEKH